MDSPGDIMRLCRLCLVKDQVNVPIFEDKGDIKKIFLKISSCLPVKVSRDDKLPKKICDGCSNKLDMLYEFWTTAANAEKTLLSWLGQAGVKDNDADETMSAVAQQIQKPAEPYVKQETLDPEAANNASEVGDHFLLQNFMQKFSYNESASTGPSATVTSNAETDEPPPKRARRTAAVKAQINISAESDEDDDNDAMEPMTKVEDESDDSDGEDREPAYVDVPGTSGADDDQPGPSGVGKDGVEAPSDPKSPHEIQLRVISSGDSFEKSSPILLEIVHSDKTMQEEEEEANQNNHHTTEIEIINLPKGITLKKITNGDTENEIIYDDNEEEEEEEEETMDESAPEEEEEQPSTTYHAGHSFTKIRSVTYMCSVCYATFTNLDELQKHVASPVRCRIVELPCEICGKVFPTKKKHTAHVKLHRERPKFPCNVCGKVLTTAFSLRSHKQFYHTEHFDKTSVGAFACKHCDFTTKEISSMKYHVNVKHIKDKTLLCDVCGKGFGHPKQLKKHKSSHMHETPYTCEVCFKRFKALSNLNFHLKTHFGDQPFPCGKCGREFRSKYSCQVHEAKCVIQYEYEVADIGTELYYEEEEESE